MAAYSPSTILLAVRAVLTRTLRGRSCRQVASSSRAGAATAANSARRAVTAITRPARASVSRRLAWPDGAQLSSTGRGPPGVRMAAWVPG